MSQLANARRQASSVRGLIRQQKYLPAVQALHDTVVVMLKTHLMKAEKDEFERLVSDGAYHITNDPIIRKSAALDITYTPGQERELLDSLRILLEAFQENFQDRAEEARLVLERRQRNLATGQERLDMSDWDGARVAFAHVVEEAKNDSAVIADIGERFLKARQYADAAAYLSDAISLSPEPSSPESAMDLAHRHNNLAMAQRKLGNYAGAEKCYLQAAQNGYKDSHLFFNMGRLYVDWERWEQAVKAARGALTLDPQFEEARKLVEYAEKMLRQAGSGG
jgi:tetratricopeptide (TPR) repeat protein